jgi:hypothetical protein
MKLRYEARVALCQIRGKVRSAPVEQTCEFSIFTRDTSRLTDRDDKCRQSQHFLHKKWDQQARI